jgi:hypothetical protein
LSSFSPAGVYQDLFRALSLRYRFHCQVSVQLQQARPVQLLSAVRQLSGLPLF